MSHLHEKSKIRGALSCFGVFHFTTSFCYGQFLCPKMNFAQKNPERVVHSGLYLI